LEDGDYISIAAEPTDRVWVFGAVVRPGQYDLPQASTALQAIAAASGATGQATLSLVEVLRGNDVIPLNLSASSPRPSDKRFSLREGDIVYVRPNVRRIAVLGEVANPGLHLIQDDLDPHVSDAIALAGGLTKRGPATRVSILRAKGNGEVERIPVDFSRFLKEGRGEFNPPIQPGDVVVVGETNRIEIQAIMNVALGLLGIRNLLR
jgi:protein involved in polysaccharide export with SLBB domain